MTSSFFEGVQQRRLRAGTVDLLAPGFYPDVQAMSGVFLADLAAVRRLLPSPRLRPLSPIPGRGLVAVHCFIYRDTPVGDYNEVSVSIGVQVDARWRPSAFDLGRSVVLRDYQGYVLQLPVNTEAARVAGVEVFDYPKFLATIRFEDRDDQRHCTVVDGISGELFLSFHGEKLLAPSTRSGAIWTRLRGGHPHGRGRHVTRFRSYPMRAEGLACASMHLNALARGTRRFGGCSLKIGPSGRSHGLADLGIRRPLEYVFIPRGEALLEAPKAI